MSILTNILSGSTGKIVDTIGKAIDDLSMSPEEKKAFEIEEQELELKGAIAVAESQQEARELDLEEVKVMLEHEHKMEALGVDNTKDARAREVAMFNSENATWFSKHFQYLFASFVYLILAVISLYVIIYGIDPTNEVSFVSIKEFWFSTGTFIAGYYFGSSRGSQAKDKTLSENKTTS